MPLLWVLRWKAAKGLPVCSISSSTALSWATSSWVRLLSVQSLELEWERHKKDYKPHPTALQMVVMGKFYLVTFIVSLLCVWQASNEQISEASDLKD